MLSLFFLALLGAVRCQDDAVLGCSDIGCPSTGVNDTVVACNVSGLSFAAIGVAPSSIGIDDTSVSTDIAWTVGIAPHYNIGDSNIDVFSRTFYLGTGADFADQADVSGCAIFMPYASTNGTVFNAAPGSGSSCNKDSMVGLSSDCVSAIERISRALIQDSSSCEAVADWFNSHNVDECYERTSRDDGSPETLNLLNQTVASYGLPLTGSRSAQPITDEQNSTSDCWPTWPKSNDLTEIFSLNATLVDSVDGVTPMLSIWWSDRQDPSVDMLCIQPGGLTEEDVERLAQGEGLAASTIVPVNVLLVSVILAVVGAAWL